MIINDHLYGDPPEDLLEEYPFCTIVEMSGVSDMAMYYMYLTKAECVADISTINTMIIGNLTCSESGYAYCMGIVDAVELQREMLTSSSIINSDTTLKATWYESSSMSMKPVYSNYDIFDSNGKLVLPKKELFNGLALNAMIIGDSYPSVTMRELMTEIAEDKAILCLVNFEGPVMILGSADGRAPYIDPSSYVLKVPGGCSLIQYQDDCWAIGESEDSTSDVSMAITTVQPIWASYDLMAGDSVYLSTDPTYKLVDDITLPDPPPALISQLPYYMIVERVADLNNQHLYETREFILCCSTAPFRYVNSTNPNHSFNYVSDGELHLESLLVPYAMPWWAAASAGDESVTLSVEPVSNSDMRIIYSNHDILTEGGSIDHANNDVSHLPKTLEIPTEVLAHMRNALNPGNHTTVDMLQCYIAMCSGHYMSNYIEALMGGLGDSIIRYQSSDTYIGYSSISYCYKRRIVSAFLPEMTELELAGFMDCTEMTEIEMSVCASIANKAFLNCSVLGTVIIRTPDSVCTLSDVNAFTGTPIESGEGRIYVPASLVDSYKTAANWSTFADQILAIEE